MSVALRDRLRAGDVLLGAFLALNSPLAAEVMGAAGLDWALVDLEHGAAGEESLPSHLLALAATGSAGLVRVESSERARSGRALDLGADGIMFPRIEGVTEAAAAVAHLRYPPDGDRGVASSHRGAAFGLSDPAAGLAEEPLAVIQIELPAAVAAAAEIAELSGVDALFVGPRDLRHALAAAGEPESAFEAALEQVVSAARSAGVAAGIFLATPDELPARVAQGFQLIAVGSDVGLLGAATRSAMRQLPSVARSGERS